MGSAVVPGQTGFHTLGGPKRLRRLHQLRGNGTGWNQVQRLVNRVIGELHWEIDEFGQGIGEVVKDSVRTSRREWRASARHDVRGASRPSMTQCHNSIPQSNYPMTRLLDYAIRNASGFTLIELLVVLSIIVILASMGLAQYRNSVIYSSEAVLKQQLFSMRDAIDQYYADKGQHPASLEALVTDGYLRKIPE